MRAITIVFCMLALSDCSLAPHYEPPQVDTPVAYKEKGPWLHATPKSAALDRGPWWQMYGDPTLDSLEAKVICSNQNLKAALARFEEARAVLAEQRSAQYPSIVGVFNSARYGTSSNVANPAPTTVYNDQVLSANATYEVDVWGRVRNSVANAKSLAEASAADLFALDLSIHAELAKDYFSLRGDDAMQQVLDKSVTVYEKQFYLIHKRYKGGASSIADVDQAQSQLDNAKTLAADMHLKRSQLEHAIAVLIGEPPAVFSLATALPQAKKVTIVPQLPSTLLERRPDIAEAELKVQAANYNIGVARAAYFPAFNLSAGIGFESTSLGNLLSKPSLTWALGPTAASSLINNGNSPLITQTIFDGGKLVSLTQQAWAQYFETVANYREAVLKAYQEVEDNLTALRQLDKENMTQTSASFAANRAVKQAMFRYKEGLTTYLDVVVIQNIALQAELSKTNVQMRRQIASVQLIKALGGGYQKG